VLPLKIIEIKRYSHHGSNSVLYDIFKKNIFIFLYINILKKLKNTKNSLINARLLLSQGPYIHIFRVQQVDWYGSSCLTTYLNYIQQNANHLRIFFFVLVRFIWNINLSSYRPQDSIFEIKVFRVHFSLVIH
jgi:hypothetical protein